MTADPTASTTVPQESPAPGLTQKVVKGSLWTLMGQVLPLGVSIFTTPIVIRLLGSEGYGAMVLVLLIPGYLGFADLGMGFASTKFGSEAFAQGDREREGRIVRTAAMIAMLVSIPFAVGMFLLSETIIQKFEIPERLSHDASVALKIASVTFVINFLCLIVNTPQLARLRMDLNSLLTAVPRILGAIATPIVIYLGAGISGAAAVLLGVSLITLAGHLAVSRSLLRELAGTTLERPAIRAMLVFGGGLAGAGVAGLMLVNVEKLVLTYTTSVETLAHYSVAFTFASMATMFSAAMTQSLLPAFSQLLGAKRTDELNALFSRALRLNLLVMLPLLVGLFVFARPLFTIWAGPEFGAASPPPFYVLLAGLLFNILAFVPGSLVLASGRTGVLAKLYWLELVPYIALIALLTSRFGAVGAALAWSTRAIADAVLIGWISRSSLGTRFRVFEGMTGTAFFGFAALAVPAGLTLRAPDALILNGAVLIIALAVYAGVAWTSIVSQEERHWLVGRLDGIIRRKQ